ncbi:alpha-amylase family glycosyl hydrolase [Methylobacterium haplocladii]|uniref:Alpha-amylase n=1 Tax=Methylobacterium haplocladii TaxID=1176176 RepID=A0A512ILV7_9HYPH|nr:alpha-amylase family glycosyl hydrolase [Methylobacterium haplocladii]GEO98684.1 alpha-amylase [Methylobacterium haplocladii]GJD83915.1 Oligo-1,6-glucosidase [Methylobacterium haplocladii]GLS57666.1 alpha-amylase [Methylobacterium haplocladii]
MSGTVWWKSGTVYQIYPRSFQDSNGDGVGDLRGITMRLDYLAWLGVDAIWISPFYTSPMADFGYDVSDYCNVDPLFGTLEDFDELIAEAHRRKLRVILDFVPNHSSIEHPWFTESRASRSNPKRDWYIWRDPAPDGGPPNNWLSNFGGPAWTRDAATGQFYYHAFLPEQPDLNWRNPAVRAAMHDVLRFWLQRGVDGFRVDVIWHLIKDEGFRDNPLNPAFVPDLPEINRFSQVYSCDRPEVFDIVAGMRKVLREQGERVLIGEIYLPIERLVAYYGEDLTGADLPFNFQLLSTAWEAPSVAALVEEYEAALPDGGWPNWVLGNHDRRRIADRVGEAQARIAAMLLLTLRGTPTLYYGDEIGLANVPIPPDRVQDPWELNEPGHGRDPERTPMQWEDAPHAGFSVSEPWLPLSLDAAKRNVDEMRDDSGSILTLHRRLLHLRRDHAALSIGGYRTVSSPAELSEDLFVYERYEGEATVRVVLNFGDRERRLTLPGGAVWIVLLSSRSGRSGAHEAGELAVAPSEGLILAPQNRS